MEVLQRCVKCKKELMAIDKESQFYTKLNEYYVTRVLNKGESWEDCNPHNEFEVHCEECFAPRLIECKKRVIGSRT